MGKFAFPAIFTIVVALTSMLVAQKMHQPASGGYYPVAYKAANKPIKGNAKYSSMHNGDTFWFVSADAKAMFDKSPMVADADRNWPTVMSKPAMKTK